jgi:hypothetical protein
MLKLKRASMPHRSSYERIVDKEVSWEELEQMVAEVLGGRNTAGRQVLLSIDGKVMRGTLDEQQNGVYLLAAYLPGSGVVLSEVAIDGPGKEIEAAGRVLRSVDLRGKVVMGDALHTQKATSIQIVAGGGNYLWLVKGNQPQLEEDLRLWFGPDRDPGSVKYCV